MRKKKRGGDMFSMLLGEKEINDRDSDADSHRNI